MCIRKNDAEILNITLTTSIIRTQTLRSHSYLSLKRRMVVVEDSGKLSAMKQKYQHTKVINRISLFNFISVRKYNTKLFEIVAICY